MRVLLSFFFVLLVQILWAQKNSDLYVTPGSDISKLIGSPENEKTYSITLKVTNIRNTRGVIRFKFYDDSTPFPHDLGFLRVVIPKSQIKGESLTVTYHGFTVKYMGIALLDDENDNWKLDYGWFFPKEGHAFSNYYHTAMRRPLYKDFRFLLNSNKVITMKMRYY